MTYCPHDDRRYIARWVASVRTRSQDQAEDESTFLTKIEVLFKELCSKYGVLLWSTIVEVSSAEDLRRMSDLIASGVKKRVPLLSIYKKIGEMEGLSLAVPDANNDGRGVVTGPGRDASPSVSPDLFFRTG